VDAINGKLVACKREAADPVGKWRGTAKRVVPDFLVGAHVMVTADRLLARDRGYLCDYFSELELMNPAGFR
jgi:hypothetical protein